MRRAPKESGHGARKLALVDHMVLHRILRGNIPTIAEFPAGALRFIISYPEYLIAISAAVNRAPTTLFRAVGELTGRSTSSAMIEASALMDLNSLRETINPPIDLVMPRAECVPQVVELMRTFSLTDSEATNLVIAESERAILCLARRTISRELSTALENMEMTHVIIG